MENQNTRVYLQSVNVKLSFPYRKFGANIITNERETSSLLVCFSQRVQIIFEFASNLEKDYLILNKIIFLSWVFFKILAGLGRAVRQGVTGG